MSSTPRLLHGFLLVRQLPELSTTLWLRISSAKSLTPNMGSGQPYLATGPVDLLESCDVLLKLDDGTELPVHSQVLARCMSVFSGMVAGGPLSKASSENVVSVPFNECSAEEATRFLSAIYSFSASEYIDNRSALSIARLSHNYGVEVRSSHIGVLCNIPCSERSCASSLASDLADTSKLFLQGMVKLCDDVLGESAGINSRVPDDFPAYLKVCSALCYTLSATAQRLE